VILKKIIVWGLLLTVLFVAAGCSISADGMSSPRSLFYHCGETCRENADFFETMKHYTPEEVGRVLEFGGELKGYKAKHYP